jgi:hypothetical protein
MQLFVVTKEGVYRHEIVGIYTDKGRAMGEAEVAIKAENDDYHEFYVSECEADKPIDDVECIARLKREKQGISVIEI